jgi:DNA gyrase subunit A
MAIRFRQSDARPMGRNSSGVKGVKLIGDDAVVGMVVADPEAALLTVCANGYGKRTTFGPNMEAEPVDESPIVDDDDLTKPRPLVAPDEADSTKPRPLVAPDVEEQDEDDQEGPEDDEGESPDSQRCYRTQRRGGKGLRDIKTTTRNGPVIGVCHVLDGDELLMITARGKLQRVRVADVSVIGRNTQGVKIMTLEEGDTLVAVKRVPQEENGAKEE